MQIFSRRANALTKFALLVVPGGAALSGLVAWLILWSPYVSGVGLVKEQPVIFSHKHHVHDLGIQCRYCHNTVEVAADAGLPATEVCMNCHAYILPDSPLLEPVRDSWRRNQPLAWQRVNVLPDHVYFNHAAHIHKGVGCETCHGRVDLMPLAAKQETLYMRWCVACHRDPGPRLRPRDAIYTMGWEGLTAPPDAARRRGDQLRAAYRIPDHLDDCYTCHR